MILVYWMALTVASRAAGRRAGSAGNTNTSMSEVGLGRCCQLGEVE